MGGATTLLNLLGVENILVFVCALTRLTPLFIIAPVFSSRQIPPQARAVIAIALAIGISPAADPGRAIEGGTADVLGLLAVEFLIGFVIAFILAAMLAALETAGSLLDLGIGFAFGAQIDPITGSQNAVIARLYGLIGVIVFITIGGDEWVLRGIAQSYELVPIGATPDVTRIVANADRAFVGILTAALQIAAPLLLALLLTDAAFGLVTRVVPQLNVFAVGLPVKVLVGMVLIGVSLPLVGQWVQDEAARSVDSALRALRVA